MTAAPSPGEQARALFGDLVPAALDTSPVGAAAPTTGLQAARDVVNPGDAMSGDEHRVEQQLRSMFSAAFGANPTGAPGSAVHVPAYPDELASLQALVLLTALEKELGQSLLKRMPKNTKPARLRAFEPLAQLIIELVEKDQ
jgi:hypothetical protein